MLCLFLPVHVVAITSFQACVTIFWISEISHASIFDVIFVWWVASLNCKESIADITAWFSIRQYSLKLACCGVLSVFLITYSSSRLRSKVKTAFFCSWRPGPSQKSSVTPSTPSACSTICLTSSNGQGEHFTYLNLVNTSVLLDPLFYLHVKIKYRAYHFANLHRYTFFIVLYPMGVAGELLTIYAALPYVQKTGLYSITLPNKYNFSFDYHTFLILIMISYIPCEFLIL